MQLNKLEEELTSKFEKENKKQLKSLETKYEEQIEALSKEKDDLEKQASEAKKKVIFVL